MRIIVDCMGGDHAPFEMLKGAILAKAEQPAEYILVGDEVQIRQTAAQEQWDLTGFTVRHAPGVITMEDDPACILREKADSSMALALTMLKNGDGDAVVSAGNTGALFTGSMLIVRKIKGLQRAGIAAILPLAHPVLLLDSGANIDVTPENLVQFARMGSAYMHAVLGIEKPEVGLLNNGTEDCKGRELQKEANALLRQQSDLLYIGNVESKEAVLGRGDVLVTDGFTGNIMIKTVEGMGKLMFSELKGVFKTNLMTKLSVLTLKKPLTKMKKKFDANEVGGAPILGIAKPVIKAHGSSNAKAFKNAILQAIHYAESGVIDEIGAVMAANARHAKAEESVHITPNETKEGD